MEKNSSGSTIDKVSLPGEIWKPIPGFSRYMVSTEGRVWTGVNHRVMKGRGCKSRYLSVLLYPDDGGKVQKRPIHRLVADAFIPHERERDSVDHINGDTRDNRACNLQWLTQRENMEKYMREHGYWYNELAWRPGKPRKKYTRPEDTEDEKWSAIDGFPGYFVSNLGNVWSERSGSMATTSRSISLIDGFGKHHNVSVRNLVAVAFLPPKEEEQVLGYLNKDCNDRRACNLYWYHPYRPMSHKRGPRFKGDRGPESLK